MKYWVLFLSIMYCGKALASAAVVTCHDSDSGFSSSFVRTEVGSDIQITDLKGGDKKNLTPLLNPVIVFSPAYQTVNGKQQFLYNRWLMEGEYQQGFQKQLIRGTYIEVRRKGNFYDYVEKLLTLAHYDLATGILLASSGLSCR